MSAPVFLFGDTTPDQLAEHKLLAGIVISTVASPDKGNLVSQQDPYSQQAYWEEAGRKGYAAQYFSAADVGAALQAREWDVAMTIAAALDIPSNARVLDIGCGDGAFSNRVLTSRYETVAGADFSSAGVERAQREAAPNASFRTIDLSRDDVSELGPCGAAFLLGILHHVKRKAAAIAQSLADFAPLVVVVEPNGNHVMRKLLELTPSYRAAGEDSFRRSEVRRMFEAAGYRTIVDRRFNLFPNFTPRVAFRALRPLEPFIETAPILNALCTMNAYGFAR